MTNIILTGCNGRMGKMVSECAKSNPDVKISAGVDIFDEQNFDYHVYSDIMAIENPEGVIVDFSNHSLTHTILEFAIKHNIPAVICSTGHTPEELEEINEASKKIALFRSANMSLGINLLVMLAKKATTLLEDSFDIEIIEKHHNQKLDAPSGTALLIADAINDTLTYDAEYKYDRHLDRKKRPHEEIGIHSVRGGTIIGEHEVIFAGPDEIVSIAHRADSRLVFAKGAVKAAKFLINKPNGLYDMNSLLSEEIDG